jgi:hypothetical protein
MSGCGTVRLCQDAFVPRTAPFLAHLSAWCMIQLAQGCADWPQELCARCDRWDGMGGYKCKPGAALL